MLITNDSVNEQTEEVFGKLPDSVGPRGTEHECLSLGTNVVQNGSDLRFEPHVQHPIRFIQHQIRH